MSYCIVCHRRFHGPLLWIRTPTGAKLGVCPDCLAKAKGLGFRVLGQKPGQRPSERPL